MLLFRELVEEVIQRLLLGRHASSLWRSVAAVLAFPDGLAILIGIDCMLGLHATVRPVTSKPSNSANSSALTKFDGGTSIPASRSLKRRSAFS